MARFKSFLCLSDGDRLVFFAPGAQLPPGLFGSLEYYWILFYQNRKHGSLPCLFLRKTVYSLPSFSDLSTYSLPVSSPRTALHAWKYTAAFNHIWIQLAYQWQETGQLPQMPIEWQFHAGLLSQHATVTAEVPCFALQTSPVFKS